jgi:hypothetical protein
VGNTEGTIPLGRKTNVGGWVDNIKSDLRGIERDGMVWIDVAQDRDQWRALVNTVMYLPSGSIECWELLEWLLNWRLLKKDRLCE